jgi:diacylglycerol kinase (CTP)
MFGSRTPPLPARVPILRLPFAPRKSLAGFIAATVTGMCITAGFWTVLSPLRPEPSWSLEHGFSQSIREGWLREAVASTGVDVSLNWNGGGWLGLGIISVVAGVVSGVAEALGQFLNQSMECVFP